MVTALGGEFHDTSVDEDRDIQEHSSFGLALDLGRTANTQWELTLSHEDTSIEAVSGTPPTEPLDLRIDHLVGGTYSGQMRNEMASRHTSSAASG